MTAHTPVFGFYPGLKSPDHCGLSGALQQHGLKLQVLHDLAVFPDLLFAPVRSTGLTLVVLAGSLAQNCEAARLVRSLDPSAGILAISGSNEESHQLALYHSGADITCPTMVSHKLVASMLHGLARRGRHLAVPVRPGSLRSGSWLLQDRGWSLISPEGAGVSLTTAERDFFQALVQSNELKIARNDLIRAIWGGAAALDDERLESRLTVVLTRLRRKVAEQVGMVLPVQTVHGWGYMFTASLVRAD